MFAREDLPRLGLSYRSQDAVIMMAGLKVDRFYVGYAFDFTFSEIRSYTYGTRAN
ncbi:MAG: type IX secretion system membrane protein PorP/SprF [Bacteroidales bacterium]|nr:type IX secretion system membrane protein PorP/SprF [Bacteroidales bacterium]